MPTGNVIKLMIDMIFKNTGSASGMEVLISHQLYIKLKKAPIRFGTTVSVMIVSIGQR